MTTFQYRNRVRPPAERFWPKVEKTEGCWLWTGNTMSNGYGQFTLGTQKISAHRFSYELLKGRIPDEFQIDHLCRNRRCVNPEHLEAVTPKENNARSSSPSAINAQKTHCPKGHPYDPTNTVRFGANRQCLICKRERNRVYMEGYRQRKSA